MSYNRLIRYSRLFFIQIGGLHNKYLIYYNDVIRCYLEGVFDLVDWTAIKTEYVTEKTSYRKLAEKHNVSYTEISKHGREENWKEERENFLAKTYSKTLDVLIKGQEKRIKRLQTITDKILNKIEKSVDIMDEADLQSYRQLTSALKDIKEIQMLKSEADMREQEARINKLNRDANDKGFDDSKEYGVVLLPTIMPLNPPNDEDG